MKKTILALLLSVLMITSLFAQVYSENGPSNTADSNVMNVTLIGENSSINYTPTVSVTGLDNQTALVATLIPGNSYDVTVTWGDVTPLYTYSGVGSVWIDWNSDGTFAESELIGDWSGSPEEIETYNFTVPTDFTGSTRMRVMQYEGGSLPLDATASFTWGSNMDFTISEYVAGTPDVPVLVSPLNGASNVAIDANLEWTTGNNTDHTVLYISESEDFTGATIVDPATSPYVTSLNNGTTYFWKVVAVSASALEMPSGVYSFTTAFSAVTEFPWFEDFEDDDLDWTVIDNNNDDDMWVTNYTSNTYQGSQVAQLYTDINSGNNDDYLITPQLTLTGNKRLKFWQRVSSSTEPNDFQIVLSTTGIAPEDFTETILPLAEYANTSYQEIIVDLSAYSGNCYLAFHVPAGGLDGWRLYIDNVTVEEVPLPSAASNPNPADDAVGVATSPLLTWTNSGEASHIDLYFGPVGNMEIVLNNVPVVSQYQVTDLATGTEYEWEVIGRNAIGDTPEADVLTWSFTTTNEPPLATTYLSPNDLATGLSPKGSLSWNSVTGADGYYVYISTDNTFADIITPEDVSLPSYDFNLAYATTYYWKVVPYNTSGFPTEGILVWSFTTMDSPFPDADVVFDGVRSGNHGMPMEPYYGYTITQNIYYQEEIDVTDSAITSISYLYNNNSAWSETIEVYMKHTSKESFADDEDWELTDFTHVYSGTLTVDTSNPIVTISLDNPFVYNNSDNLMVMFFATQSGYHSSSAEFYNYPVAGNRSLTKYSDGTNYHDNFPGATPAGTLKAYLPVTGFTFEMLPTEAVFTVSAEELTFAETEIDMISQAQTLTISNAGLADLGITSLSLTGANADQFQLTDNNTYSVSLATNENLSVDLAYTPTATGEHTAQLDITDDQMRVVHTVQVTASSVDNYIYAADMPWSESFESELNGWRAIVSSTSSSADIILTSYESNVQDGLTAIGFTNSADANANLQLISPTFYSGLTSTRLTFWTKGSTGCSLIVGTYDHQIGTFNEIETITLTSDYAMQEIFFLPSRTSQRLAFKAVFGGTYQNIYLDNLQVVEIPDSPQFEISANSLEFAHAIINDTESEEQLVTVRNTGMATLELNDIRLRGDDPDQFSIIHDNLPINLGINETTEIRVSFSPSTEGVKSATLNIGDNVEARATNIVNLSGTAVDPTIYADELDPYFLDFENAQQILGWEANITSTSTSASAGRYESSSSAYEGDYSFRIYHPSSATSDFEVVSPLIVPDMDLYRVRFMAKTSSLTNTDPLVIGKYNASMDTFTEIQALTLTTSYAEYTVDLIENEPLSRANERLVFKFQTEQSASKYIYLDNVRIEDIPLVPLAELSVTEIDFGDVDVELAESATESVSITNVGPGTLNITNVAITGTDATMFSWEYVEETPDMALENNESLAIDVTFAPTTPGDKGATLVITDDLGRIVRVNSASKASNNSRNANEVALTGFGWVPPQGSTCADPLPLTFPAVDVTGNTGDFLDDYENAWVNISTYYLAGDDVVYQFTLANAMLLNGTITTPDSYLGAFILQDEPNAENPVDVTLVKSSGGQTLTYTNEMIPAGTYYLIISSWPAPQSIDYTINLTADPLPAPVAATSPSPADEAIDQPTALTLTWNNADYTETVDLWFGPTPAPTNSRSLMATRNMVKVLDNVAAVEEYAVTDLDPNTEYSWKVVNRNYTGETVDTLVTTWTFTTIGNAPEAVTYTAPANEATDVALSGSLTWQAGTGANGYYVYLSTDDTFTGVSPIDQVANYYDFSDLDYSTTYYWKVIPYNVVGQATENIPVWSFTTIPDPTISTFPWTETFTTWPAENWSQFSGILAETTPIGTGSSWSHDEFANIGSTTNSARLNIYGTKNHWLVTPPINLDANVESLQLDFDIALTTYTGNNATALSTNDYVAVVISTDNGVTWSNLNVLQDWSYGDEISHTGDNYAISLEGYSGIVKFGFYAERPSGYDPDINVYFDNITVREIPTAPIAQLSATEIDLASVLVNETSEPELVTITNVGVGELIVSNVEITGDDAAMFAFDELTLPATLLANEMLDINVTFNPTSEGEKTATLTITDNTDASPYTVTLTGTGLFNDNNNTPETATELTLDVVGEEFAISIEDDIDWYKFYCIAGTELNMYSERETNGIDTKAWFYGPNLEDGSDIDPTSYNTYNDDDHGDVQFEINTTVTEDGWYYLRVAYYSDGPTSERLIQKKNGSRASTGIYWLHLYQTLPAPEVPINFAISNDGATITLSWEAAANANSYNIYACDTPDGDYDEENPIASVSGLTHTFTASETMKFFKVKASSDVIDTPAKGLRRQ